MLIRRLQNGVTVLELLIAMTISSSLMLMAIPSFGEWLSNARIRTAAESMQAGLQQARAEAVKRNTLVRFGLTSTATNACVLSASGTNWVVSLDDPSSACANTPSDTSAPRIIQARSGNEGTLAVNVAGTSGSSSASALRFNGLGQLVTPTGGFSVRLSQPTGGICRTAGGDLRCLQVQVSAAGEVKMCDPALPSSDPEGC